MLPMNIYLKMANIMKKKYQGVLANTTYILSDKSVEVKLS